LITEEKEWVQKNLANIHEFSSKHRLFNLLQDYLCELINNNPELFLKSNNIEIIEKSMLLTILKSDF